MLEERLRFERIAKYGPGSESLSNLQLELLELEPGVSSQEVAAESEREALPPATDKKKRKHPSRQTLPAKLPRVEKVIACTPEQCCCSNCGAGDHNPSIRFGRGCGGGIWIAGRSLCGASGLRTGCNGRRLRSLVNLSSVASRHSSTLVGQNRLRKIPEGVNHFV